MTEVYLFHTSLISQGLLKAFNYELPHVTNRPIQLHGLVSEGTSNKEPSIPRSIQTRNCGNGTSAHQRYFNFLRRLLNKRANRWTGAKYYLHTVLHDWDDEKSIDILTNLPDAMSSDSRILIDDMVLSNTGVHWWSTCLDLHMLTMLGAWERNVDQSVEHASWPCRT